MNKITIIGAGLSGTQIALNIIEKATSKTIIYLIEKKEKQMNRGIAYQTMFETQPLNVTIEKMSLKASDHNHFYDWLIINKEKYKETLPEFDKTTFVPRKIYGDYIEFTFNEAIKSNQNVTIEKIEKEVININKIENDFYINLSDNTELVSDKVVLAIGNFPPTDILSVVKSNIINNPIYKSHPWKENIFKDLKKDDKILIIGAGLTMLDMLIKLDNSDYKGEILVISRNGFLPQKHEFCKPYKVEIPSNLEFTALALFKWVRKIIKNAENEGYNWRAVIDDLREHTTYIWTHLPENEKLVFFNRIRPYWETHRHRMPQKTAELVEKFMNNNQLQIDGASIQSFETINDIIEVKYISKKDKKHKSFKANLILNCTGPESNLRKIDNPLIVHLITHGMIVPDIFNLGIKNGENGNIIDVNNLEIENFYTIGSLRKGRLWETTALKEIREQAEKLSELLIR